jgi:predicted DsbA family dithiol-disulfide isomerase
MTRVEVVEYTDPWCSWAWGTEPKMRRLRWRYADRLDWRTVMGDLVPTRDGVDLVEAAPKMAGYWEKVHDRTGMPWPAELRWAPSNSAVPGLAVKAAQLQGDDVAARLLRALRESCFIWCAPADRVDRVLSVAATVVGLDPGRLADDLDGQVARDAFAADREETRRPNEYVRNLQETHEGKGNAKPDGDVWRYVFPTVLFRGSGGEHTVPGWQPWEAYVAAMEAASPGSTAGARPDPSPDEALQEWSVLTDRELSFLCGDGSVAPDGAVAHRTAGAVAWLRPDARVGV